MIISTSVALITVVPDFGFQKLASERVIQKRKICDHGDVDPRSLKIKNQPGSETNVNPRYFNGRHLNVHSNFCFNNV